MDFLISVRYCIFLGEFHHIFHQPGFKNFPFKLAKMGTTLFSPKSLFALEPKKSSPSRKFGVLDTYPQRSRMTSASFPGRPNRNFRSSRSTSGSRHLFGSASTLGVFFLGQGAAQKPVINRLD